MNFRRLSLSTPRESAKAPSDDLPGVFDDHGDDFDEEFDEDFDDDFDEDFDEETDEEPVIEFVTDWEREFGGHFLDG